jgi:hypothetical protein
MNEFPSGAASVWLPHDRRREVEQHDIIASLLAAYVDGELPPETATQLDAHLRECARCARDVGMQRQLAAGLGQIGGPLASAALHTRIRQSIAALPAPGIAPQSALSGTRGWRFGRWGWGAVVVLIAALWLGRVLLPAHTAAETGAEGGPVAVVGDAPLLDSLAVQWRALSPENLPGRERDVDAIRRALGGPVFPLESPGLDLAAAWTTTAWGELLGVLAYRFDGRLVVQFTIPEALLARSGSLSAALARSPVVLTGEDALSMVLWRTPGGATVLLGNTSVDQLRAFQTASAARERVGTSSTAERVRRP